METERTAAGAKRQQTSVVSTNLGATNTENDVKARAKFFHKIGIDATPPPNNNTNTNTTTATPTASWLRPPPTITMMATSANAASNLFSASHLDEALKYDRAADAKYNKSTKGGTTTTTTATKKRHARKKRKSNSGNVPHRRLCFSETVKVLPIPTRHEYSSRVRSRLWSGPLELYENAVRNSVEFEAEGWDWRTVAEDEHMYTCLATGELVHPCHYKKGLDDDNHNDNNEKVAATAPQVETSAAVSVPRAVEGVAATEAAAS